MDTQTKTELNPTEFIDPAQQDAYERTYERSRSLGVLLVKDLQNQELQYAVSHDSLTGLLNKAGFSDVLNRRMETAVDGGFGIVFADLDNFKRINDDLGHDAGDDLLKQASKRLKKAVRKANGKPGDAVAHDKIMPGDDDSSRVGGDEFVFIIDLAPRTEAGERMTPEERLNVASQHIQSELNELFAESEHYSEVGISMGGAVWHENMSESDLLKAADQAMFDNKRIQKAETGSYR